MEIKKIEGLIEALLFASGEPVHIETLAEITSVDSKTLINIINRLSDSYLSENRGIQIREINGAYQLCSKIDYFEYVKKLFEPRQKQGLSQAALETLSIIAYNQPETKVEIEKIRGVNSDSSVNLLLERNLIKEAGRMDAPGKPILFETTEEFLRAFGYKTLAELPPVDEMLKNEE
ncbi:MAG: SMC-Scp complex subunit ScpB [Deltaproteobacteria bacterium]